MRHPGGTEAAETGELSPHISHRPSPVSSYKRCWPEYISCPTIWFCANASPNEPSTLTDLHLQLSRTFGDRGGISPCTWLAGEMLGQTPGQTSGWNGHCHKLWLDHPGR